MKREVIKVSNIGEDALLVHVKAGAHTFVEYYVGVDKSNPFFKTLDRDESVTVKDIKKTAFAGCNKYLNLDESIAKKKLGNEVRPLDGAWLSFYRMGTTYEFLADDLMYYGGGMCIRTEFTYDECVTDALIMIDRLRVALADHANKNLKVWDDVDEVIELFKTEYNRYELGEEYYTVSKTGVITKGILTLKVYGITNGRLEYFLALVSGERVLDLKTKFLPESKRVKHNKRLYLTKYELNALTYKTKKFAMSSEEVNKYNKLLIG